MSSNSAPEHFYTSFFAMKIFDYYEYFISASLLDFINKIFPWMNVISQIMLKKFLIWEIQTWKLHVLFHQGKNSKIVSFYLKVCHWNRKLYVQKEIVSQNEKLKHFSAFFLNTIEQTNRGFCVSKKIIFFFIKKGFSQLQIEKVFQFSLNGTIVVVRRNKDHIYCKKNLKQSNLGIFWHWYTLQNLCISIQCPFSDEVPKKIFSQYCNILRIKKRKYSIHVLIRSI